MKKKPLFARAAADGVPKAQLEAARDQDEDNGDNEAVIALLIAHADEQASAPAVLSDSRYEDVAKIHGRNVRLVRSKETGDERVAKRFTDRERFEMERQNLKRCKDEKGEERIVQFQGEHEPSLTLYLEYARGGSLKERLDHAPRGLSENDCKQNGRP